MKNILPIFVFTFIEYGGLYHIIFRLRFLIRLLSLLTVSLVGSSCSSRLVKAAICQCCIVCSNVSVKHICEKTLKKCNNDKTKTINIKARTIASKLKLEDRIQISDENDAYISIKDHKEGFPDEILYRLITHPKLS